MKAMDEAAKEPKKTFNCYSCGIDCTRMRFHYAKSDPTTTNTNSTEIKYDLCPNCFYQGRLPSSHHSSDFVKLEDSSYTKIPDKGAPWTPSETLLMLEAVENFDENWQVVAKHVGTRTSEECLLHFLTLDIEGPYLDQRPEHESATMQALSGRAPITQSENPVLSVLSFLAELADPSVVAAASNRSVSAITESLRANIEKGQGGQTAAGKGKAKEASDVKAEDAMDTTEDSTVTAPAEAASNANGVATSAAPKADAPTVTLASAAAQASALASHEEREMTRLVGAAVNLTLQKFELKLAQFSEMEEILQAERRDLEKGRQDLFLDRLAFKQRVREVESALSKASLNGSGDNAAKEVQNVLEAGADTRFTLRAPDTGNAAIQPYSAEAGSDFKSFELQ